MTTPTYTPELLTRLIWETKNIQDHYRLVQLYESLQEQGDICFTAELRAEFALPPHYWRFAAQTSTLAELADFAVTYVEMQEEGLATNDDMVARRILFQRELLSRKNPHDELPD